MSKFIMSASEAALAVLFTACPTIGIPSSTSSCSFLHGLWVRYTVCAASHLTCVFASHTRVLIGSTTSRHIEQGSSMHHFQSFLIVPLVKHPRRGNRSTCVCILCTHVLYTNFCDVGCVFGPNFPCHRHAILLLAQLIRTFIGTAETLDGPSSYLLG
ncbi:hypothetical protein EDB84DRAFT_1504335 [Lactarius hengduanensis]|nr:hypothetical protein EDB84DRAFT_1504335 [Lactarius hengduanensis]